MPTTYSKQNSRTFSFSLGQVIKLKLDSYRLKALPPQDDGSANFVEVELWDVTHNHRLSLPPNQFYHPEGKLHLPYDTQYRSEISVEANVDYQFRFTLYGELTHISYSFDYLTPTRSVPEEKTYYGQRVKQIITTSQYAPPISKVL